MLVAVRYESTIGGYRLGRSRGGGGLGICACDFGGRIDRGGGGVRKRRVGRVRLTTTRPARGPSYLGGGIFRALFLVPCC